MAGDDPLVQAKEELIELAESLSVALEAQLDLAPTLRLPAPERRKATHRLMAQIRRVAADLRRLNSEARGFAVHSF